MQVGSYQAVAYLNQTCLGGRLYRATDKEVAGSYRVIAGNTAAAPGCYSRINDFTDTAAIRVQHYPICNLHGMARYGMGGGANDSSKQEIGKTKETTSLAQYLYAVS